MNNTLIDLDTFLNQNQEATGTAVMPGRTKVPVPSADRMLVALFMVDDSGSIHNKGLTEAVREGVALGIETLHGIKGSGVYVIVEGFKRRYFEGMIEDIVGKHPFAAFEPDYDSTPLVSTSIKLKRRGDEIAAEYRAMGIPTKIGMITLTDGNPQDDYASPSSFQTMIGPNDYIVGMGVARNEEDVGRYARLFKEMGITHLVSTKDTPQAVRRALNEFSQSVVSIAAS